MRYVIAYDIADDARRERVSEALKGYGRRIQESVFLADLESELAGEMEARLGKMLGPEDKGHVFALCRGCAGRARTFGLGELEGDADFYIL